LLENVIVETGNEVAGAKAFELYDTFGFQSCFNFLRERGLGLDEGWF
jgi:alanyl-tRNA synthetase